MFLFKKLYVYIFIDIDVYILYIYKSKLVYSGFFWEVG